jgi:hypothetical protein
MERRLFLKAVGLGCIGCCCGKPLDAFAAIGQKKTYSTTKLLGDYDLKLQWRRELYLKIPAVSGDIDNILVLMRNSYEAIIPDIPYIGKRNFHLQWAIPNAEKLADYLVAKEYGVTIPQFSRLHLDQAFSDLMAKYPTEEERRKIGSMQFGPLSDAMMRFVAWRSQLRIYPEDYILKFVPGDGVDFDWGLNYTQCPNVILYSRHGAADLVYPLICTMDYVAGKALFVGYHRTMDLASGGPMCDLRWKKDVESEIPAI